MVHKLGGYTPFVYVCLSVKVFRHRYLFGWLSGYFHGFLNEKKMSLCIVADWRTIVKQ